MFVHSVPVACKRTLGLAAFVAKMDSLDKLDDLVEHTDGADGSHNTAEGSALGAGAGDVAAGEPPTPTSPASTTITPNKRKAVAVRGGLLAHIRAMGSSGMKAAGSGSSGVKAESCTSTPRAKKQKAKEEDDNLDDAYALVGLGGEGSPSAGDPTEKQPCPGCKRLYGQSGCFIAGGLVQWSLPGGRGAWCRECFNLWRICFQPHCKLFAMHDWLLTSSNYDEWELCFAAYVSLKREGVERVTELSILGRKSAIEFALRLLSLPSAPFEVMPLDCVPHETPLQASRLVTLVTGEGVAQQRILGYMADANPASPEAGILVRRPGDHTTIGWQRRSVLRVSSDQSTNSLNRFGEDAMAGCLVQETVVIPEKKGCKDVQTPANSLTSWAISSLRPYETSEWATMKESTLSPTIAKLDTLAVEAGTMGNSAAESLEQFAKALTKANIFIRKHSQFARAPKLTNLIALEPYMGAWVDFLRAQGLAPHFTMVLLRLRADFSGSKDKGIAERFKQIADAGLGKVLADIPDRFEPQPDAWLRSTLFAFVADLVERLNVQDVESKRSELQQEMQSIAKMASAMTCADKIQDFIADVGHLQVVFASGGDFGAVSANDAARAKEALKTTRFGLLRTVFGKSAAGQEFMSGIGDILRRSASDEVADARLKMAVDTFADTQFFKMSEVVKGGEVSMVVSGASVLLQCSPSAYNMLLDILHIAVDAGKLWSMVRRSEQCDVLHGVMVDLCDKVRCIDLVAGLILHQACDGGLASVEAAFAQTGDEADAKIDEALSLLQSAVAEHAEALEQVHPDSALSKSRATFLEHLVNCSKSLSELFGDPRFENMAAKAVADAKHNAFLRELVVAFLQSIINIKSFSTVKPEALIEEWRSDGDSSFIAVYLEVLKSFRTLAGESTFEFGVSEARNVTYLVAVPDEEDDGSTSPAGYSEVRALPARVAASPIMGMISDVFKDAASSLCSNFVVVCEISGMTLTPGANFQDKTLAGCLEGVARARQMPRSLGVVVRELRQKCEGSSPPTFPSTMAYHFMQRLFDDLQVKELTITNPELVRTAPKTMATEDILAGLGLLTRMHEVSCGMLFLGSELRGPPTAGFSQNDLRGDVCYALDFCEEVINETTTSIASDINMFASLAKGGDWVVTSSLVDSWMKTALAVVVEVRNRLYAIAVDTTEKQASSLEKHTPRFDHFLNDTMFNHSLSKKHLLPQASRFDLGAETVKLFHCIKQLGMLSARFDLGDARTIPMSKETLEYADIVFKAARQAVTVSAGVNAVLNMTGTSQRAAAQKLLDTKRGQLPKALLAEVLLKAASQQSEASAPSVAGLSMVKQQASD